MYPHFPHPTFVGSAFGPEEFDHEFIETSQNGHFMFAFDEFDHVSILKKYDCGFQKNYAFYFISYTIRRLPAEGDDIFNLQSHFF